MIQEAKTKYGDEWISSILDTDLYKFTVSYAYMRMFPEAECTFTFVDRNHKKRDKEFLYKYTEMLEYYQTLQLTDEEFDWCVKNISFIPAYYWEWLKSFHFDISKIDYGLDENDELYVHVTDKCYKATLYEIPCLYAIPEIENIGKKVDIDKTLDCLDKKIDLANRYRVKFSEFGARRRFNWAIQNEVVKELAYKSRSCTGTSNVWFAKKCGMTPMGTHPHEWFMFHGAQFGYEKANYLALENWSNIYDGDLGIALSDCYGVDAFLTNFSLKLAKLFDGVRQDSGDEYEFGEKMIEFYKSKGIDPKSKTIVFSNALDFDKALKIWKHFQSSIKVSFGIGTNLTCDVVSDKGEKYLHENIVMKMTSCRMSSREAWLPCVKLSDDFDKAIGDPREIEFCKYKISQMLNNKKK